VANSTATIALKLETKDFATKANDASTSLLGLQVAAGGAGLAFRGMGAAARSGVGEFALGAVKVDALTTSLGKASATASTLSGVFGKLSSLAYNTALATTAISGVAAAAEQFARIPQTLNAISASGVSTQTISEFNQMRDAIGGNQTAVEGFVNSAIARLGQFEQAAARSATILKSSTRFDDQGNALRVNAKESMQNALSIQTLVNTKLDNAVTSTDALLAQYEVLSGGFSKQVDSEQVLETALKLTQIGGAGGVASNAGDNAKLLGKTLQAYSLSASDAAKTGAILNAVVENGITTIPELSSGFGAASSSAKAAGISMQALGAGVATLTSIGQDTSEALTGFKGLSDAIINKTPEAAAELSKLSLNGQRIRFDTAEVSTKGFTQALIDLYKATGNSPQALAKIFPNQVAYRAAIGLLTQDGAKFASTFEAVNGATAQSLNDVAKGAGSTRIAEMQKLANKFGELVISIATQVAPVVEPGLNALKRIADAFNKIPEPIKQALGQWIAAQVVAQSTAAGIGILVKTLGDLAGIYAIGRVIGLAMTGQLGAELTVIKQLIVQRKGLGAVLLQTIGINQRHRLSVDAASAALANQGVVAKGVYAAQAKGSEVAAAASAKFKDIVAKNVAGAKLAAEQFGATPTAGKVANVGLSAVTQAKNAAKAVANSQTGQNIRAAASDFLGANPAIGTAGNELKAAAQAAIERVKAEAIKLSQSEAVTNAISTAKAKAGQAAATAQAVITPTRAQANQARISQITDAELNLKAPELVAQSNKIGAEFEATKRELAAREKTYITRTQELERKRNNFVERAERLENIKDKLSPEAYQKSLVKLNQDAEKLTQLGQVVQKSKQGLAEYQVKAIRQSRNAVGLNADLASRVAQADTKFAPLVAVESKLQSLNDVAAKAKERAEIAKTYADNLAKVSPGSEQAIAAKDRSIAFGNRSDRIAARAETVGGQYQGLLDSTGARTALLNQQGLAQTRFGGKLTTYNNSGIEKILYDDIGKTAKSAGLAISGGFTYVTTNATRAAIALGAVAKSGATAAATNIKQATGSLFGKVGGGITAAFKEGGLKAVVAKGFDGYIGGTAALGQKALPFLPPAIAGAVAPVAVAGAIGALVLRDDIKRGQLAGEFSASVSETLKKQQEIKAKYDTRTAPLTDLRASAVGIDDISKIDPVRAKLKALEQSGELTAEQLAKLDGSLTEVGKSGKISTDALKKFTAQLDGVRTLDRPLSKGIVETIGGAIYNLPGQALGYGLGGLNNVANLAGGTIGAGGRQVASLLSGDFGNVNFGKFVKDVAGTQAAREADSLVGFDGNGGTLGELNRLVLATNSASTATIAVSKSYGTGSALDKLNAEKLKPSAEKNAAVAKYEAEIKVLEAQLAQATDPDQKKTISTSIGEAKTKRDGIYTLTTADIEREKLAVNNRLEQNKALTADYDNQIKILNEQKDKITDPQLKAVLDGQIKGYTDSKEALEKNTEGLKNNSEAFAKYQLETLPGLIRALKETSDPVKAVDLAGEDFKNIYQNDASGKATTNFKDIATLRADSAKYQEALLSKYSVDNTPAAETTAIEGLKSARDNKITLANGESGFRETIAQRIAMTGEIVKIQAAGSDKIIAAKTIESEKLKVLTSKGALGERDAQIQSQTIGIDVAREKLAAKEREIKEYAGYPLKTVQLEREAAQLRIAVEQQVADKQRAIRDRAFTLSQAKFDIQAATLKTAESRGQLGTIDANEQAAKVELAKSKAALDKLKLDRSRLTTKSPELDNQIALSEQQYQQQQAIITKNLRERKFALSQAKFDGQAEQLKTQESQLRIGAGDAIAKSGQIEIAKERAALAKLLADRSRLTTKSPELDNQISSARERLSQTIATNQTQVFEAQLAVKKQILAVDTANNILPLTRDSKRLEIIQKTGELQSNILSANKEILTAQLDNQNAQLSNESSLANSAVKRAKIELDQSQLKLKNIPIIQAYERQSLVLQQELTALGFKQQQNQLQISAIENQRTIKELQLQKLKLDRDKSNSPEIKAQRAELENQLATAKLQESSLKSQGELLGRQAEVNSKITDAKLKQNVANQATAIQTANIDTLLKSINVATAKITENTERQNLLTTAGIQKLSAKSNAIEFQTKQYENQTKLLGLQQSLIASTADGRVGELGVMNSLTTIESVKLNIAQQTAQIKLASLTSQIQFERDILELNIKQAAANFEQDKLKQKIAEKNAERDIVNSRATLAKLDAKGSLADPLERQAAEIDLSAKLDAKALVESNRVLLVQQGQILTYQGTVQRQQLDITQRGKLQGALAEVGETSTGTRGAYLQNQLFNAVGRQEGTQYYVDFANQVTAEAKLNPIALPQFNSPYDSRSNYNVNSPDPTKLAVPTTRSGAGSLDFSSGVDVPRFRTEEYNQYQRNARSRYEEFVVNPINTQVSPQVRQVQQESQERTRNTQPNAPEIKPIVVNLQMTNDLKINVADSKESKDEIVNNTLGSIEQVLRLVEAKYK
jgi:hypothetical protein